MDVIEQARILGKALQASTEYVEFQAASKLLDEDKEVNDRIAEFNLEKVALSQEMQKDDKSQEKIDAHNNKIKELYAEIMNSDNMRDFNEKKDALNRKISFVNEIILASANGDDPDSVTEHSCTGSCSTCGGCH